MALAMKLSLLATTMMSISRFAMKGPPGNNPKGVAGGVSFLKSGTKMILNLAELSLHAALVATPVILLGLFFYTAKRYSGQGSA